MGLSTAGLGQGLTGLSGWLQNYYMTEQQKKQQAIENANKEKDYQLRVQSQADEKRRTDASIAQQAFEQKRQQGSDAMTRASQFSPNEPLTPDAVNEMNATGNGGYLRTVGAGQTTLPSKHNMVGDLTQGVDAHLPDQTGQVEGVYRRPNTQERQFEQAHQESVAKDEEGRQLRANEGRLTRQSQLDRQSSEDQARLDRQRESDQNRKDIATIAAGSRAGTDELKNEIMRDRLQTSQDKRKEADSLKGKQVDEAVSDASNIKELTDRLEHHPGFGSLVGSVPFIGRTPEMFMGGTTTAAKGFKDQLMGMLTLDKIGEMKRQSRTGASGFGQLSEKELAVLQGAAGRLDTSQNESDFKIALQDIRNTMDKVIQRNGGKAASGNSGTLPPEVQDTLKRYPGATIRETTGGK